MLWLTHVNDLAGHPKAKVTTRLSRQPGNRTLRVDLYQILPKDSPNASLIAGTWKREDPDTREEEIVAVDLRFVLSALDGMEGSPFADQMDRWAGGWAGGSVVAGGLRGMPEGRGTHVYVLVHLQSSCTLAEFPPSFAFPFRLPALQADGCLRAVRGRVGGQGGARRAACGQPHHLPCV